jgi:hypothetical protein
VCESDLWRWTPLPLFDESQEIIEQPVDLSTLGDRYAASAVEFITRHSSSSSSSLGVDKGGLEVDTDLNSNSNSNSNSSSSSNSSQINPFLLQVHFSHVHVPLFCGTEDGCSFATTVSLMDVNVGTIVTALDSAGLGSSTLVFFLSDNGPWLLEGHDGGSAYPFRGGKFDTWEGGFRTASVARWTGTVLPGTDSSALVTTTDIFATAVALAGALLPSDLVLDGKDLTPLLLGTPGSEEEGGYSPHSCIFFYQGTPTVVDASNTTFANDWGCDTLFAMRCGQFKAHWFTFTSFPEVAVEKLQAPLVFDLLTEGGLRELDDAALEVGSELYSEVLAAIDAEKRIHLSGLVPGLNQMGLGDAYAYAPCADQNSQEHGNPDYPPCTVTPENFYPFGEGAQVNAGVTELFRSAWAANEVTRQGNHLRPSQKPTQEGEETASGP